MIRTTIRLLFFIRQLIWYFIKKKKNEKNVTNQFFDERVSRRYIEPVKRDYLLDFSS